MLKFGESGHPVFRATGPLSRNQLKSKGKGKLSIHCCADHETIETVFRTIVSVNQRSLHGAVAEVCEEYESYHNKTGRPVVEGEFGSSFVPSVIKTNMPLNDDDPAHKEFLLQRYRERIEKLSQQDRLSKFCAGFLNVVKVGQYFMTKDTEEFSQFRVMACREYTLPRDEEASQPKGWIQGNTKIGPALEIATLSTRVCTVILRRDSVFHRSTRVNVPVSGGRDCCNLVDDDVLQYATRSSLYDIVVSRNLWFNRLSSINFSIASIFSSDYAESCLKLVRLLDERAQVVVELLHVFGSVLLRDVADQCCILCARKLILN